MIYRFGRFALGTRRSTLAGADRDMSLEQRARDVLTLLVEIYDRRVNPAELIRSVRQGCAVLDTAFCNRIRQDLPGLGLPEGQGPRRPGPCQAHGPS